MLLQHPRFESANLAFSRMKITSQRAIWRYSGADLRDHSGMTDSTRCILAHEIASKMFAIIAHCDELELRVPSPWVTERTAKIKAFATDVSDALRATECTLRLSERRLGHKLCPQHWAEENHG